MDYYLYGIQNHVDTSQLDTMLCCQLFFILWVVLSNLAIQFLYIDLLTSSLFCLVANKGLHDISVERGSCLISSCWDLIISVVTGFLTFICCGFTRTKFMVLCFLVWVAHCWVLHMIQVSATSSCTTKGHPVVLSSEKELNFEGNIVAPPYGCHKPSKEFFRRLNLSEVPVRETHARYHCLNENIF